MWSYGAAVPPPASGAVPPAGSGAGRCALRRWHPRYRPVPRNHSTLISSLAIAYLPFGDGRCKASGSMRRQRVGRDHPARDELPLPNPAASSAPGDPSSPGSARRWPGTPRQAGEEPSVATTTTTRNDEQIQQDVLEELSWDARVQRNEVGVSVKDGVVALTGWVDSYAKKWAAEQAAHRVRGVGAG